MNRRKRAQEKVLETDSDEDTFELTHRNSVKKLN